MTPTARTLAHLRSAGWALIEVVERWNPHARIRRDLFGIVDALAVGPQGVLGVQTTSASNVAARLRKVTASEATALLLAAGGFPVWHCCAAVADVLPRPKIIQSAVVRKAERAPIASSPDTSV